MNILVTGAAGFIGSNYVKLVLQNHADTVIGLDSLTYAGNFKNLANLEQYGDRFTFMKSDIAVPADVSAVFEQHNIDAIVNFAAETHVDRSLMDATAFINTNVFGTQQLLDAARKHGIDRYLQISTDEVYGSLDADGVFTETSPIEPNNPYAATKASSDMLVRAAHRTHGLDTVITRSCNNFGPYQFPEKLIPLMTLNALEDKDLPIYGDGLNVRDWIYVEDNCSAVHAVLTGGTTGEIYNIGASHDITNLEVVKSILEVLGKGEDLIKFVTDRPGHDRRYATDSSKLSTELGWSPKHNFKDAIRGTVEWYRDNTDWWQDIRSGEYEKYYQELYGERLAE